MAIQNSNLPPSVVNEVVKIVEDENIVRSNLKSVSDVYSWIEEYGRTLNKTNISIHSNMDVNNSFAYYGEEKCRDFIGERGVKPGALDYGAISSLF
ncbi:hypothetical protein AVEN_183149-1 [Araneus ventricosus]|uniref:Uncharacterized protein n=1 Tax=Araneus ventricosus TaxID=182803 RepID=A0A4Y2X482_ARAVE|nr:hypothetical protein AVEN_183149-1 [Araneus ventricosus]